MPSIDAQVPREGPGDPANSAQADEIQFPPVSSDHILNCSYDKWFPKYRSSCIKSTIIPLSADFISYLGEDGILLADDDDATDTDGEWLSGPTTQSLNPRSGPAPAAQADSDSEDDAPPATPPNRRFPDLHNAITTAIADLGGSVVPKLNWSTPKDATWISPFNTLKCTTANDIYLLLKSSSFVSHDLEHPFDDCVPSGPHPPPSFAPVLVLRPHFAIQPSLEFRCFVKNRTLIGISQRDLNHYDFLPRLEPVLVSRIRAFFDAKLRFTFPDPSFAFDVYVPENGLAADGLGDVRLMDINPWAPRTDTLLFGWGELLEMRVPNPILGSVTREAEVVRLELSGGSSAGETTEEDNEDEEEDEEEDFEPELRIIEEDDPEAYNLSSSRYGAHKLPKDVVDASMAGEGGLAEFAKMWRSATGDMAGDMWQQPTRGGKDEDVANIVLLFKDIRGAFSKSGRKIGLTYTIPSSFWYLQWFDMPGLLKNAN